MTTNANLTDLYADKNALRDVLKNLVDVVEAHNLESLDCDNRGDYFCDCLSDAVKKAKEVLDNLD